MSTSTNIERRIDVSFPLDKVKKDIERVGNQGFYCLHSKNDILNTYRIGYLSWTESIMMNITLKVLENGSTNIHIVIHSGWSPKLNVPLAIDKMIDAFLQRLNKVLTGATDEELKTVSAGNKGCMVTLFAMIGIALAVSASAAAILF